MDKKAIVSVRVSEVAYPEGSPRAAVANVNGVVDCTGGVVLALALPVSAATTARENPSGSRAGL